MVNLQSWSISEDRGGGERGEGGGWPSSSAKVEVGSSSGGGIEVDAWWSDGKPSPETVEARTTRVSTKGALWIGGSTRVWKSAGEFGTILPVPFFCLSFLHKKGKSFLIEFFLGKRNKDYKKISIISN